MIKLNLLDISEENVIFEKSGEMTPSGKSGKDEREFSLETVDELFQSSHVSKQSEPPKAKQEKPTPSTAPPPQSPTKTKQETIVTETEGFEDARGKSLLIVTLVVILILGGVAAYYFLFMKSEPVTPSEAGETISEEMARQSAPAEAVPGVPSEIQALYQENKTSNVHGVNMAQRLMNLPATNIQVALMVLTPTQIQLSVQAGSRGGLDSYQATLRQNFPASQVRLVNTEEMRISGENKILADFTFTLSQPQTTASLDNYQKVTSEGIQTTFRSLAQRHQINLQSIKKGQPTRADQVTKTKFYSILSGDQDRLMRFIQEIADRFPAILFTKIALNPSDWVATGRNQMTARINFVLNEALLN